MWKDTGRRFASAVPSSAYERVARLRAALRKGDFRRWLYVANDQLEGRTPLGWTGRGRVAAIAAPVECLYSWSERERIATSDYRRRFAGIGRGTEPRFRLAAEVDLKETVDLSTPAALKVLGRRRMISTERGAARCHVHGSNDSASRSATMPSARHPIPIGCLSGVGTKG